MDRRAALDVLGLADQHTRQQLRQAYRRAARATHPDLGSDPAAFRTVQAAYELLQQPQLRASTRAPACPSSGPPFAARVPDGINSSRLASTLERIAASCSGWARDLLAAVAALSVLGGLAGLDRGLSGALVGLLVTPLPVALVAAALSGLARIADRAARRL